MAFHDLPQLRDLIDSDDVHGTVRPAPRPSSRKLRTVLALAFVLAASCSGTRPAAEPPTASPVAGPWIALCPPVAGGADVSIERDGSRTALVLTTIPTMADDVYDRVERLGAALPAKDGSQPRTARASVSRIENGARLSLEPSSPAEAAHLAEELTALLRDMRSGGCPPRPQPVQPERAAPHETQRPSGHHH